MEKFIHLNVKSEYSLLNSIAKTKDLIKKTTEMGSSAIALTDINNMFDVYHFEQACKKNKIHHIIGVTFCIRFDDGFFGNIELLAKDITGYKNLVCLSTLANKGEKHTGKDGFAYLDFNQLKDYSQGLICLTGGTSGIFYHYFSNNSQEAFENRLMEFKGLYQEALYFEFQNHSIQTEIDFLNSDWVYTLLSTNDIEVVATNDVYYMQPENSVHRDLALEMNPNKNGLDIYSGTVCYNNQWYLKTPDEMETAFAPFFSRYPRIFSNTLVIEQLCQAHVPVEKALPEFPIPKGYTNESYLRFLCEEGFHERFDGRADIDIQKYRERLDYEFDVISKMGFVDYHIITADFIQWAKDDKVYEHPERYFPKEHYPDYSLIPEKLWKKDYSILVGPGRGSAAGSLLCYCLKITNLDPIKDGLLFERFLNVERVSMPK